METSWRFLCAVLFVGGLLFPSGARAAAIGISPGEVTVTVLEGTMQEFDMMILRSGSSGEGVYTVETSGDSVLTFVYGASATIPDGSSDATYPVRADASHVPVGVYESVFRFVHVPDFNQAESGNVLVGASANIHVHVVDRSTYLAYLREEVFSSPEFVLPASAKARDTITIESTVRNGTGMRLGGFTYEYILFDGSTEVARSSLADVQTTPYGADVQRVPFLVKKEGMYTVQMQVFYGGDLVAQSSQTLIVLPPKPIHWFPMVASLFLMGLGGVTIARCYSKKG